MTEDFVSYPLAQAMKNVGFDEQVPYFYSLEHSDPPTPNVWKKPAPKGGLMKFNNTELALEVKVIISCRHIRWQTGDGISQ